MASDVYGVRHPYGFRRNIARNGGLLLAFATFAAVVLIIAVSITQPFGYFDFSSTVSTTTPLALAAIGETIVVIGRGLDLSAGAVISLSNCLVVTHMGDGTASIVAWTIIGILAGTLVGLANGILVVAFRLQPIVATLATMFIAQGLTLLVMNEPGGAAQPAFTQFFTGDAIPGVVPMPAVVLGLALLVWGLIRLSPFSTGIYAIGSDPAASFSKGLPVSRIRLLTYVIAGTFYGAAGVFLTAQTGSGDPTVGPPMLLSIFAAVVLGGTALAGGTGGCVGTVFGSFTLMLIVNLLLVYNISPYFSTVVEGGLLILAAIALSVGRGSAGVLPTLVASAKALLPRASALKSKRPAPAGIGAEAWRLRQDPTLPAARFMRWCSVNVETLRFVLPSFVAFTIIVVVTQLLFGGRVSVGSYLNSLLVLTSFLAILALGQGVVVLSGGLDLSIPSMITLSGVLLTGMTTANSAEIYWALPVVLAAAALVGALNGLAVALFGISPLIVTLAMNGILYGVSLIYCGGTPAGHSPESVTWAMTGSLFGITPIVYGLIAFVVVATLALSRTVYGRYLYAVGNGRIAARYAGVPIISTIVTTYALSSLCAAVVGIMLVGFSGQAFNDMGDPYLLPSIAAVVVGGTLMSGGRGHYLGMFGGALALTALTTALSGSSVPVSVRSIIFGAVILSAVLGLRGKTES
jgi:ribose transport system permease protein